MYKHEYIFLFFLLQKISGIKSHLLCTMKLNIHNLPKHCEKKVGGGNKEYYYLEIIYRKVSYWYPLIRFFKFSRRIE